ncbi:hypothetical protein PWT90_00932 [Aphanocladium album]|nr:hypothetical protein PWT90_00932 [Aphanocladium album]
MSTTQTEMAPAAPTTEPEIPQLTYNIAQTIDEKRDALRLVADTIAQQRQVASTNIIFHPAVLGPFVALLAGLVYRGRNDWVGAMILISGVIVAYLASIQYYTYNYLQRAESFNWKAFITPSTGNPEQQDIVMYARYGDNVIATLVLRLEKAKNSSKTASRQPGDGSNAQIRAWATRLRYRNAGIGGDMLREAVTLARDSLGSAVAINFSNPHAHTIDTMQPFTAPFRRREVRAEKALAQAIKNADAVAQ